MLILRRYATGSRTVTAATADHAEHQATFDHLLLHCLHHDWTHRMSDDMQVVRAGEKAEEAIIEMLDSLPPGCAAALLQVARIPHKFTPCSGRDDLFNKYLDRVPIEEEEDG